MTWELIKFIIYCVCIVGLTFGFTNIAGGLGLLTITIAAFIIIAGCQED